MADLPILFSTSMVRAIIREIEHPGTGKTQTRRVLGAACDEPIAFVEDGIITALDQHGRPYRWPNTKAVGNRLYVREAWRTHRAYDDLSPSEMGGDQDIWFEADKPTDNGICPAGAIAGRFRQGMHMPRWASRITLTVTDVRTQRLQEISEADAIAEGLDHDIDGDVDGDGPHIVIESWRGADYLPWLSDPVEAYADLWDQLNDARGYGWDANPWVAAYTFMPTFGNIDQVQP